MSANDRFLVGVVVGVVLLVALAFGLALHSPAPTYRTDDTPEATVNNYILALQRRDYAKAYAALAGDLPGRPTSIEQFVDDVQNCRWCFKIDESFSVVKLTRNDFDGGASVEIELATFHEGGLFNSDESRSTFGTTLRREPGGWKITRAETFWYDCWRDLYACRDRRRPSSSFITGTVEAYP